MKDFSLKLAGTAVIWKAVQLAGVKSIFLIRLLILARLLTPEDFGLVAIAVSSIGVLLSLTNFGMVPALVQGKDIDENHYNAAWTVNVTRALLVSGVVMIAAPFIAQIFAEPRAITVIQALTLRPLLEALASIKVANLARSLQFRPLTVARLSEALVNTVVAVVLAQSFGVWALVIGALAGSSTYLVLSYILAPHRPRLLFDRAATRPLIRFGQWIFLTSVIAMAGSYVLRIVISRELGAAGLGLYFLAAQLAFLPAEIASEVVGAVAFPLFARLQLDLNLVARTFRTTLIGISALLFPVCALLIILAPTLVQDLLGPRWEGTTPVIQVLAFVTMIGVFGEVTGPIFTGLGQPYRVTVIEIVQSLLIISLVWGLTIRFGLVGAALAWLPTVIISQVVSALFIRQILPRPFARLGAPMLLITIASTIGAVVAMSVNNTLSGLAGLITASLLAMAVICGLLWVFDRRFTLGLMEDLGQIFPKIATLIGYSPADG